MKISVDTNKIFAKVCKKVFGENVSFPLHTLLKNLFYIFVGYGLAGVFVFIFEILAGRVLGPSEYGKYVLADSLGLFFYLFMTLGVNTALVHYLARSKKNEDFPILISSASAVLIIASSAVVCLAFLLFPFLAVASGISLEIFAFALLFAVSYSLYIYFVDILRGIQSVKKLALSRIFYGIFILFLFFIFLYFLKVNSYKAAILSICISNITTAFLISFSIRKFFKWRIDSKIIFEMLRYGFAVMLGASLFTFLPIFSKLLVNKFLSATEVGIYNVYYFSSFNIMIFLYEILITILFPEASKYEDKKSVVKKVGAVMLPFSFGAFFLLFFIQSLVFKFYGSQYPEDYFLAALFSFASVLMAIYCIYSWIIYSRGMDKVKYITILSVSIFLLNIVLGFFLVPVFNLAGAVWSVAIAYACGLICLFLKRDFLLIDCRDPNKRRDKIKVCHVASTGITVNFLLMGQLKFLMRQGYDVYVICSSGKWENEILSQGIKLKNIRITRKVTPFSDIVSFLKLYFYFKKEGFDIVHTHTPKPALLGQVAAKLAGVPVIINTVHGLYFKNLKGLKKFIFATIFKFGSMCSTLIFSQNMEDISVITENNLAKPEKLSYLGNGVDISKFNSRRFLADFIKEKKEKLDLGKKHPVLGVVGRLVKEKGYFDLFTAFKEVLEEFPHAVLLVIGPEDPEKRDSFGPEVVRTYGIEKSVIFLGERTDVDELYSLMDIFVLPSWREGFPRSVIEAMAMKKPVIATDIRGCREAIKNGVDGVLVPSKNPKALAEAILRLSNNSLERESLANNARNKAISEFDEKIVFDRIKKEYERLISKKNI